MIHTRLKITLANLGLPFKDWLISGMIFIAGLTMSIVLFVVSSNWQRQAAAGEFVDAAYTYQLLFQNKVEKYIDALDGLKRFHASSNFIDRVEFAKYVVPYLNQNTDLQALEWIPRVSAKMRSSYESDAHADGLTDFTITERDQTGKLIPAGERKFYYPVFYLEPMHGNEAALGFDLGSNETRRAALQKAMDSGQDVATARIRLVQETSEQYGFLLFKPVYENGVDPGTVKGRRNRLLGFMLGVFRIGDILESSIAPVKSQTEDLSIIVRDITVPSMEQILHVFHAHDDDILTSSTSADSITSHHSGLEHTINFNVADREWSVTLATGQSSLMSLQKVYGWSGLVIGLMFTILVAVYYLSNRYSIINTRLLVKQRTAELSRSEQQIRSVVETIIDGVITIDGNGSIESFNPAAEFIFGYMASEVKGHNVNMLMPAPYHDEHDQYIDRYLETGERRVIGKGREVVGKRKDGTTFPMYLAVGQVDIPGRTLFTGIVRDISDRVEAENKISNYAKELKTQNVALVQAIEEVEEATRAKSEFLSNMSHELRTPLNSVIGFANVLIKQNKDNFSPDNVTYIERIQDNGRHLLGLINDILDLSKIESGKLEIESTSISLVKLVQDTISQMEGQLEDSRLKLQVIIPDEVAYMTTDETKLKQVIINLVGNALKFTKEGSVTVEVKCAHDTKLPERIDVTDTGPGIPDDRLQVIFDAFQQADSSTARKYGGTGLGLTISRSLCKMLGYQLEVASEVGVGTTFSVILSNTKGE